MFYIDNNLSFKEKEKLVLSLKRRDDTFTTKCEKCGVEYIKKKYSFVLRPFFLCKTCQRIKNSLEKYGTEHPMGNQEVKSKQQKTVLEKYGVKNSYQTQNSINKRLEKIHSKEHKKLLKEIIKNRSEESWEEIKNKTKETCLKKYGTDCVAKVATVRAKYKETCLSKYGVDNFFKTEKAKETSRKWASSKEFREKVEKTLLDRYGETILMHIDEFKSKQQKTVLEKYGAKCPAGSKEVVEKMKKTMIEKYGENYIHNIRNSSFKKIDGTYFDSSWEYAFWKYHKDNNSIIKREPIAFEYYVNGKKKFYIPDFECNGLLYEIKGDYFFNDNGDLINPYDSKKTLKEKEKCIKDNGVIILKENDMKMYFEYMSNVYGENWKKDYKNGIIPSKKA